MLLKIRHKTHNINLTKYLYLHILREKKYLQKYFINS